MPSLMVRPAMSPGCTKACMQSFVLALISPRNWPVASNGRCSATYKGLWTKLKKNVEHRRVKITKKRFKGLDKPPKYSSPTVQYTYERDYTFQCDSRVSVGTLNGRISVPYQGYDQHIALIRARSTHRGCEALVRSTEETSSICLFPSAIEKPDPTPESYTEVVGVDVGIRYLAVTSTSTGKTRLSLRETSHDTKPTITHAYANACSTKALVVRNVV